MENIKTWFETQSSSTCKIALISLIIIPSLLVAAVSVIYPPAAPIVGCLAGLALFVAAYAYWHTMLSTQAQEQTDLKEQFEIKSRRAIVLAMLAVWIILILLAGPHLPRPLVGTLTVFVAASLYWVWKPTTEEAADMKAAYEAAVAQAEADAALLETNQET